MLPFCGLFWSYGRRRIRAHAGRPGRRLALEVLEDRCLPSFTFSTLASFDGANPNGPIAPNALVADSAGDLFGTTGTGGANNNGAVFEIPSGTTTIQTVASFDALTGSGFFPTNDTGANPSPDSLVIDGNGDLFGTTWNGGANGVGTVYEVVAGSNTITPLASFDLGVTGYSSYQKAPLVLYQGNLFGINAVGGANGAGTVFEIPANSNSNTITVVAAFNGANGYTPDSLAVDANGNLFGTTDFGGSAYNQSTSDYGAGVVFEVPQGSTSITPLISLSLSQGGYNTDWLGNLIVDGNDNLFATMAPDENAHSEVGPTTVVELPQGGASLTTLASFGNTLSSVPFPTALVEDANGNLFGTTQTGTNAGGTLFEVVDGGISTVTTFGTSVASGGDNGDNPNTLIQSNGNFFGTTQQGGFDGAGGAGTVFELATGPATITWSGAGKNHNWSAGDNWVGGQAPKPGDNLVFPAGAKSLVSVNDLPKFAVGNVEIDAGYAFSGKPIALYGNVTVTAGNTTCGLPITLDGGQTPPQLGSAAIAPDKEPQSNTINVGPGASLNVKSPMNGPSGVNLTGGGDTKLPNDSYQGMTAIDGGTVTLNGQQTPLGKGPITVSGNATIDTTGNPSLKDSLTLQSGSTLTVNGKLNIYGAIMVPANSTLISGGTTSSSSISVHGTLAGKGTLTLQLGSSNISLEGAINISQLQVTGGPHATAGSKVLLAANASGTGMIVVNGGYLACAGGNGFTGTIQFQAGAVGVVGSEAIGPEATLDINPPSATAKVTLAGLGSLACKVNLQGGIVAVAGVVALTGPVNLAQSTEIDPFGTSGLPANRPSAVLLAGTIALADNAPVDSLLTLGGTAQVELAGQLQVDAAITGQAELLPSFNGGGSLTVNAAGAELISLGSTGAYNGTVSIKAGSVVLAGTNPLGTGELDLGTASGSASVLLKADTATLGNTSVNVAGTLLMSNAPGQAGLTGLKVPGAVTLTQDTSVLSSGEASLILQGALNTANAAQTLTVDGSVILAGNLAAPVDIGSTGFVDLFPGFAGNGSLTVDGGILRSDRSDSAGASYTGRIALNSGRIVLGGKAAVGADLGTGPLTVNVPQGQTALIDGTIPSILDNPLTLQAGTLGSMGAVAFLAAAIVDGGTLGSAGKFLFTGGLTIDAGQLNIGGTVWSASQPLTLTGLTRLTLSAGALLIVDGAIAGDQALDVTGAPQGNRKCQVWLRSNIGATVVTAKTGSVITLYNGFGGVVPTADGGRVVDDETKP